MNNKHSPAVGAALLRPLDIQNQYGIDVRQLKKMRWRGTGPPFIKVSRSVFYRRETLEAWLESNEFGSTSEYERTHK